MGQLARAAPLLKNTRPAETWTPAVAGVTEGGCCCPAHQALALSTITPQPTMPLVRRCPIQPYRLRRYPYAASGMQNGSKTGTGQTPAPDTGPKPGLQIGPANGMPQSYAEPTHASPSRRNTPQSPSRIPSRTEPELAGLAAGAAHLTAPNRADTPPDAGPAHRWRRLPANRLLPLSPISPNGAA